MTEILIMDLVPPPATEMTPDPVVEEVPVKLELSVKIQTHPSLNLPATKVHESSPVTYAGPRLTTSRRSDTPGLQDVSLFLLPVFKEADLYASMDVRIPSHKTLFSWNVGLRLRAVWFGFCF
jgi:hypothetical protein